MDDARPAPGRTDSDESLVARLAARDRDAFTILYQRHVGALRTYAARFVGRADADDVAQDALLELMRTRGAGVTGDHVDRYLKTVARGACARRMRESLPEDSIANAEPWVLRSEAKKRDAEHRG